MIWRTSVPSGSIVNSWVPSSVSAWNTIRPLSPGKVAWAPGAATSSAAAARTSGMDLRIMEPSCPHLTVASVRPARGAAVATLRHVLDNGCPSGILASLGRCGTPVDEAWAEVRELGDLADVAAVGGHDEERGFIAPVDPVDDRRTVG